MPLRAILAVLVAAIALALPASVSAQSTPGTTTTSTCVESDAVCLVLADLEDLQATVDEQITDRSLAFSLDVKVQAATDAVLGGQYAAALGQLEASGNEVVAAEQSGRLGKLATSLSNVLKKIDDTMEGIVQNQK